MSTVVQHGATVRRRARPDSEAAGDRVAPGPVAALEVELSDGRRLPWVGLQAGPRVLDGETLEKLSRELIGVPLEGVAAEAERVLVPATGELAQLPAVILHSTTPELKTFEADRDALARGLPGGDFTTYKEARSVYLARPGDLVVGRTEAWRGSVRALGAQAIDLGQADHYYLSHALLARARDHRGGSGSELDALVSAVRESPRVVRLYAFEREMQLFLLWLARTAGVETLAVEANTPRLSAAWNRKAVLHPTVDRATGLDLAGASAREWLEREAGDSELTRELDLVAPVMPGYTIERADRSIADWRRQLEEAARLLRRRHGLHLGCLKASEAGDGARITPGVDLADLEALGRLAEEAHVHGDDYVLEAHVEYGEARLAGVTLPTTMSAHVRGGRLAPGATVQFVEGTSWKGNVMLDDETVDLFGIPREHYLGLRDFVEGFRRACERKSPGLVLAGIDAGVGRVGGGHGGTLLLGVQDLNVSFTGAECLRSYLDRVSLLCRGNDEEASAHGVTRIFRPAPDADHSAFLEVTRRFAGAPLHADTVASIPGRWAMVAISGRDPRDAIENLAKLEVALRAEGLIAP